MDQRTRAAVFYEFFLGDVHALMERTESIIQLLVGDPLSSNTEERGLLAAVTLVQDAIRETLNELLRGDGAVGLTLQRMMLIGSDVDLLSSRLVSLIRNVEAADIARGDLKSALQDQQELLLMISRRLEILHNNTEILEEIRQGLSWWPRYGIPVSLNSAVITVIFLVFDSSVREWVSVLVGY